MRPVAGVESLRGAEGGDYALAIFDFDRFPGLSRPFIDDGNFSVAALQHDLKRSHHRADSSHE